MMRKNSSSLDNIVNIYWPQPITILELAELTGKVIAELTHGKVKPRIDVINNGQPAVFMPDDKLQIKVNIDKLRQLLSIENKLSEQEPE